MTALAAGHARSRGTELLLVRCGALQRPTAAERLSAELGSELAARLVSALARDRRGDRWLRDRRLLRCTR